MPKKNKKSFISSKNIIFRVESKKLTFWVASEKTAQLKFFCEFQFPYSTFKVELSFGFLAKEKKMQLATFSELLKLKLAKNETLSFAHPW